jgi:hypothetical protein
MHREPPPQQAADLLSEPLHQRLAPLRTQIVRDEVYGVGLRLGVMREALAKLDRYAYERGISGTQNVN